MNPVLIIFVGIHVIVVISWYAFKSFLRLYYSSRNAKMREELKKMGFFRSKKPDCLPLEDDVQEEEEEIHGRESSPVMDEEDAEDE